MDQSEAQVSLYSDRENSFMRKSISLTVDATRNTSVDGVHGDLLHLLTAVGDLLDTSDDASMKELEVGSKELIGQGGVFSVSKVQWLEARNNQTSLGDLNVETVKVIIKELPPGLFNEDGLVRPEHREAAQRFILELRILSTPSLRAHSNIIRILGLAWEYATTVRLRSFDGLELVNMHYLCVYPDEDTSKSDIRTLQISPLTERIYSTERRSKKRES